MVCHVDVEKLSIRQDAANISMVRSPPSSFLAAWLRPTGWLGDGRVFRAQHKLIPPAHLFYNNLQYPPELWTQMGNEGTRSLTDSVLG